MKFVQLVEGSMSAVCPEKAVPFYEAMVEASARFGTKRDRAFLQGLYAIMLIEIKGDGLKPARDIITKALEDLSDNDNYIRVVLMRRLGWIHIRLGNNEETKRQLTIARKVSYRVPKALEAKLEPHRIHINSHLAIVYVFLGKYTEAYNLLLSTIPRARKCMPDHPILAVMLQTVGLKLEREGSIDEAIIAYKASGTERRKLKSTLPTYLVTNQTNLASIYLWRGETEKALPLLESALNIRRKLGWRAYNTALALWYRGNAYLFSDGPDEAERSLNQAMEVLIRVTPQHTSIVNIRVSLAHAHMVQGRHREAEKQFQLALDHSDEFQHNINGNSLLTALEHLVLMKSRTDEVGDIHNRLIQEAERLSVASRNEDPARYILMQRKLTDWRVFLGILLLENETRCQRERQRPIIVRTGQIEGRELGAGVGESAYVSDGGSRSTFRVNWEDLFTCEHCKMLNYTYETWFCT